MDDLRELVRRQPVRDTYTKINWKNVVSFALINEQMAGLKQNLIEELRLAEHE